MKDDTKYIKYLDKYLKQCSKSELKNIAQKIENSRNFRLGQLNKIKEAFKKYQNNVQISLSSFLDDYISIIECSNNVYGELKKTLVNELKLYQQNERERFNSIFQKEDTQILFDIIFILQEANDDITREIDTADNL